MPAFVANGPDIPEHLLQAHEDGHLYFFAVPVFPIRQGCLAFKVWWIKYTQSLVRH